MKFLDDVEKSLEKDGFQVGASEPPRYWYSTGNHVLNKILSGSFMRGIPQGRITCLAGPSGSGKSFLAANIIREAQKDDTFVIVLDSENALDDEFVGKIGVDVDKEKYKYYDVDTIPQVKKIASKFISAYNKEYKGDPNGPKILFVVDSLDMLMTETELGHFEKGVSKGDQGQRNKQLKAVLRELVQAIKHSNISILVNAQVYRNQDPMNGEGLYIVSEAIRFSLSHITMLTKLKLRGEKVTDVEGIRMKCEGYKTRFTKPFQTVTIEVPYETGMDPYNGLVDVAVDLGVVDKRGSRYTMDGLDKTHYKDDLLANYADDILVKCEAARDQYLEALIDDTDLELPDDKRSAKSKRKNKADTLKDNALDDDS